MLYENENVGLTISPRLKESLNTAALWAKIVAIVSFITAGLGLFTSIADGNFFSAIISTAISILINIYLLNFGRKVKVALEATSQEELNDGLHDLRMYFKVYGIVLIVVICIVFIAVLFAGSFLLSRL